MSESSKQPEATSADPLAYAPIWARHSGHKRPVLPSSDFLDDENPGYRDIAAKFASGPNSRPGLGGRTKMLIRFGLVTGFACAAILGFVGYLSTRPDPISVRAAIASMAEGGADAETPPGVVIASAAASPSLDVKQAPADSIAPVEQAPAPEVAALPPELDVPSPATKTAASTLSQNDLVLLMQRGRSFIDAGDFASARPVYKRAAEAGYADAALALGETYDPAILASKGVVGMSSDVAKARLWYQRALDMGSFEASARLSGLPAS